MGATRQELLDLANFWEERGDLQEAHRLRVSAGETPMYALYRQYCGSTMYMSPDMIGDPTEDREALEQKARELRAQDDEEHRYGNLYEVVRVKQQTVWVRL